MGKCKNHTPRPIKKSINIHSRDQNTPDSLDCLPKGWTVEVRVRKSGYRVGQEYKCYVAPLTGSKFYSKKDVSRYLETTGHDHYKSEPKKRRVDMDSRSNVVVQRIDHVDGLPPGWIQEIRVTKKTNSIRKDPYYTDPVAGYIFRSKRAAVHYVETGEVGKYAIKPMTKSINDAESRDEKTSPPATKRRKLEGTDRLLFMGQSSNSNETVKDEQIPESLVAGGMPLVQHASDQSGECTDLSSVDPLKAKVSKKRRGKKVRAKKRLVSAPPEAGVPPEKQQLDNGVEKHGNKKTSLGSSKRKYIKKVLDIPRRTSKRLAGLYADPATDLEAGNQTQPLAAVQPPLLEANPDIDFTAGSSRAHQATEQQLNQLESDEPETNTTPDSSKGTENPLECEKTPENQTNKFKMPLEERKLDPQSEEKADEKPGSPIILPFGDSWPDPCLEFAFKTLTGAIPVEDNLGVQDFFQLQPSSTQTNNTSEMALPGFGTDGFDQTDDLFQFDLPVKPSYPPDLQEKPLIPPPGNESVMSFGGKILQQPSGEGKKDC